MFKRIFSHLPAKIFSLVIAIAIWFHVITENYFEYEFDCILKIINIPTGYVVFSEIPDHVTVKFWGKGKDLIKMFFKEHYVYIDAAGFKYGNRKYEIAARDVDLTGGQITVREIIMPKVVPIFLDNYETANLPIKSDLYVTTSPGNILNKAVEFDPAEVVVEGPQTLVKKMEYVYTERESLINVNKSMTRLVDLKVEDSLLQYIPSKTTANIGVEVAELKSLYNIGVSLINVPEDIDARLGHDRIDLEFEGTKEDIEALKEEDIEVFVDFAQVSKIGPERLKPNINTPEGIRCSSSEPEYFKVIIEE